MREIKYKAYHRACNKMCEVISLYQSNNKVTKIQLKGFNNIIPVGAVELLEYTGLKDKNGGYITFMGI